MSNCSGRASFNTAYEVTPMRQPSKSKDSVLSAEAPEFVPQVHKQPVIVSEMAGNIGSAASSNIHQLQHSLPQPPPPTLPSTVVHQAHHPFNHVNHHNASHIQQQQPTLPPHVQLINHTQFRHNPNHLPSHQQQQHYQPHNHHQPQSHHHSHHSNHKNSNYSVNNRLQQFNGVTGNNHRQSQPIHFHQQQGPPPHQQHMQQQQPQHSGNRSGGPKNNNNQQSAEAFNQNDAENDEPSEAAMHALSFLIDIIEKLMNDPGQFENYQKELTTLYIDHAENQHVISNAIELFFIHSIEEQNFRYTGARLCRLLDSIDPSPDSLFRRLLCCKLQYNDSEIMQYMNNETHKVRNTTLFLAELYIQLQNDGSRITSIANSIHNAISLLMPKTSPENIKCVCQTLKLCGYELDIDFPKETEELMNQLSSCENTDVSTQRLLATVIDLRKNRWGRSEPNAALSQPLLVEQPTGKEYNNDPVFYGPDGNVLTDEESAFLWNVTSCPTDGYDDDEEENDPDALVEIEPEMDLEIQLAFKDFVTYQNKK